MKTLQVQLQPDLAPDLDFPSFVSRLHGIGDKAGRVRVSEANDNGRYINVSFDSANIGNLWQQIREELCANVAMSRCSVVCCEGDAGWDDYLLLHHFDPEQQLDNLP